MIIRTPTKVMVNIIDTEQLAIAALKFSQKSNPKYNDGHLGFVPHGIVITKKGMFALNGEGIGPSETITITNEYEIPYYASIKNGNHVTGNCFPTAIIHLNNKELEKLITGEQVNLADFIRKFGSRLESNYTAWREALEKIGVDG